MAYDIAIQTLRQDKMHMLANMEKDARRIKSGDIIRIFLITSDLQLAQENMDFFPAIKSGSNYIPIEPISDKWAFVFITGIPDTVPFAKIKELITPQEDFGAQEPKVVMIKDYNDMLANPEHWPFLRNVQFNGDVGDGLQVNILMEEKKIQKRFNFGRRNDTLDSKSDLPNNKKANWDIGYVTLSLNQTKEWLWNKQSNRYFDELQDFI